MIDASLSYLDIAVIGILALSCIVSIFRGFVKELLSISAWIGAGLITLYYFQSTAELFAPHFQKKMVASGAAALALYVGSLLVFSIINSIILRFIKEGSDVGMLDNVLGLAFGFARGAFIVSLAFLMATKVVNKDDYPTWIKQAKTLPYLEQGAKLLASAAPEYLQQEEAALRKQLDTLSEKAKNAPKRGEESIDGEVIPEKSESAQGAKEILN